MKVYDVIEARQPEVIEELRRRRLLRWRPGVSLEESVVIGGHTYRDVTEEVAAASTGGGSTPGHDAYKRVNRRVRQVRHG